MGGKTRSSMLYNRVCRFVLFFVAASASFNGFYGKWHFREINPSTAYNANNKFERMVDGTATRPYVYRQLLPSFANWMDKVTSVSLKTRLYNFIPVGEGENKLPNILFDSPVARDPTYFFRYLVVYTATFLCSLLAVYAMYLVCLSLRFSEVVSVFAPAIVILLIPYILSMGGYFYDYPELAFLALAVWIAIKFDWWWIIPVAVIGTLNKESFLLAIPSLYPFFRQKSSRTRALLGTSILCLASMAVYIRVHMQFAHNPGGTLEYHWHEQLDFFFLHPGHWIYHGEIIETTYGILLPQVFTILPMTLLIWTVWRSWSHLPRAIQRHGQIAAAINIPLYLLFCKPGELRDLSLLYVFFLAVIASNLNEWITYSDLPRQPQCEAPLAAFTSSQGTHS